MLIFNRLRKMYAAAAALGTRLATLLIELMLKRVTN
jgi:hypothetical protein